MDVANPIERKAKAYTIQPDAYAMYLVVVGLSLTRPKR